jgi:hypothetical protein
MKILLAVMAMAALGGCVVAPTPRYYTAAPQPYDPYQWHTVPSEPAQAAPVYSSRAYSTYEPVYAAPVYVAPPVYQPYYYEPALTFGLGVLIGNSWGRGSYGGGHRHYRSRR